MKLKAEAALKNLYKVVIYAEMLTVNIFVDVENVSFISCLSIEIHLLFIKNNLF